MDELTKNKIADIILGVAILIGIATIVWWFATL